MLVLAISCSSVSAFSDTLSSSAPSSFSSHSVEWSVSDSSGITSNQGFLLDFDSLFDLSGLEIQDVVLRVNSVQRTLVTACGISNEISLAIAADRLTFILCPSADPILTNDQIEIIIGDGSDSLSQVKNPDLPGGYKLLMQGQSGYGDSFLTDLSISGSENIYFSISPTSGTLRVAGQASPGATIYIYEQDNVIGSVTADSKGYFEKVIHSLSLGIHSIGIWCRDLDNRISDAAAYQLNIAQGQETEISGIILSPTFSLDQETVKRSAPLWLEGRSFANAKVGLFVAGSHDDFTAEYQADSEGKFRINLNNRLHLGLKEYNLVAYDGDGGISSVSHIDTFEVLRTSDIDNNGEVASNDLSTLAKDYLREDLANVLSDINDNGRCNLSDLSIMMRDWTTN